MTNLAIDDIKVGKRHRKDLGDLDALAASIDDVGLEHPIVVTPDHRLVAGQRRLEAVRQLGWLEVPVRILPLSPAEMLRAERDENEVRKDFTPTEAVAIGRDIEEQERPLALERMRAGVKAEPSEKFTEGFGAHPQVDDVVANAVGMSRPTYQRAKAVVRAAEDDPENFGDIADQMDATGKVTPAYKELRRRQDGPGPKPKTNETRVMKGNPSPVILTKSINSLSGVRMALERVEPSDLANEEEADQWTVDLSEMAKFLNRFSKQLKEAIRG